MFKLYSNNRVVSIVLENSLKDTLAKMVNIFAGDIQKVTGMKVDIVSEIPQDDRNIIVIGIAGKSAVIDSLGDTASEHISKIIGKNECYTIFETASSSENNNKNILVIAGSDKRGAIYGMFSISEYMGVSPWYFWADAPIQEKEKVIIPDELMITSKEPSVRYRGIFINDEQPCFGNWAKEKYGSIRPGPELYEKIFELILRLKGNYIWPAMWRSDFTLDNIENARLATEMGIIVGASHHEPCCRSGQEFQTLNKTNSQYGKEWSFLSNADGITEFWKDGLIRNKDFENLITIGMRGENDSYLMPADATLADNINVLKSAITRQKELIAQYAPSEHPQLLAIYKEVEDYYYGDENTKGLKDWDVLQDDIMMLCDDNFANVRTLPDEEMRQHPGGFGMYYHFDYFGAPVSYLWINTSPLTKVWEQLTMCYDYGIRAAWIVNVGDIKNQELPISYFMDLAYDFDKWGTNAINKTMEYTEQFMRKLGFKDSFAIKCARAVTDYTRINAKRRPEPLNKYTYHPVHENEASNMLRLIDDMTERTDALYEEVKGTAMEECFYQIVYYPVNAVAAINRMQIYAGLNTYYASKRHKKANVYAELVQKCIEREHDLTDEYHNRNNGKWNHMQSVAHIGYNNWNEEMWEYPVCNIYYPIKDSRLLVSRTDINDCTHANRWNRHVINLPICIDLDNTNTIEVANGGEKVLKYRIDWDEDFIQVLTIDGVLVTRNETMLLDDTQVFRVVVLRDKWDNQESAMITIYGDDCETLADESENSTSITKVEVQVNIKRLNIPGLDADIRHINVDDSISVNNGGENQFIQKEGCISIEAVNYTRNLPTEVASYKSINDYGRTLGGVKVYPQTLEFDSEGDAPALEYDVYAADSGEYTCMIYTSPSNPVIYKGKMVIGLRANDDAPQHVNTIPDKGFIPWMSESWSKGVLDQIHICSCKLRLNAGKNVIKLFARDPAVVVEKIVLWSPETEIRDSYLGPQETRI